MSGSVDQFQTKLASHVSLGERGSTDARVSYVSHKLLLRRLVQRTFQVAVPALHKYLTNVFLSLNECIFVMLNVTAPALLL